MKKSKVYKRRGKSFRYDFDNALVCWVAKATHEELEDNEEWLANHGSPLFDIDPDGYMEISSVGLGKSNWTNKEMRDSYLDQWIDELEEESAYLLSEFIKFG